MFWAPENVTFFHSKMLFYKFCKFHIKDERTITSLILLMLTMQVIMAQDKTPKRGCRWPVVDNPLRSRLTRRPSHDWSSTARVAHQGRRSWGWGGSDPLKICKKGQSMFWPLKISHSFIQNCCCLQVSQHPGWIVGHYHFTDLAYLMLTILPSLRLINSKETCPPINAFAAPLGLSHHDPRQNSKTWAQVTRRRKSS